MVFAPEYQLGGELPKPPLGCAAFSPVYFSAHRQVFHFLADCGGMALCTSAATPALICPPTATPHLPGSSPPRIIAFVGAYLAWPGPARAGSLVVCL